MLKGCGGDVKSEEEIAMEQGTAAHDAYMDRKGREFNEQIDNILLGRCAWQEDYPYLICKRDNCEGCNMLLHWDDDLETMMLF